MHALNKGTAGESACPCMNIHSCIKIIVLRIFFAVLPSSGVHLCFRSSVVHVDNRLLSVLPHRCISESGKIFQSPTDLGQ